MIITISINSGIKVAGLNMTWTRRSIILNASFQGKFMMSDIYLQCAQIFCKVSYWFAMKTVEGVDLTCKISLLKM